MKRLIVVAALVTAACAGHGSPEVPLPEGRVVLGTFTADVDLAAGTFEIRTNPAAGKSSGTAGSAALANLDASVTVANVGLAWIDAATPACISAGSPRTWGAVVTVKNNLSATTLSGVYAEITSFVGGTGLESCSNATVPTGLDGQYGLWSYGSIAPGATSSQSNWIFKYATASKFSFSGRIVGVKVDPANVASGTQRAVTSFWNAYNALADNGTTVLVAGDTSGIDFVDSSTGLFQQTVATAGLVDAIAVAPNRIWYSTRVGNTSYRVGWMNRDGGAAGSAIVSVAINAGWIFTITPDPTFPDTKAWFVYENRSSLTYIQSYTIGTGPGTATTTGALSYGAALGSDNRLYVSTSDKYIHVFSLGADPATEVGSGWYTGIDCGSGVPQAVAKGLDSTLYVGFGSGAVCSVTTAGIFALKGSAAASVNSVNATASSEVWAAAGTTGIKRVDTSGPGYAVGIPGQETAGGSVTVLLANGYLWTTTGGKLWRVTLQ